MKVLVTGGLGFIGSHICLELLKNNYEVIIIDSLVNSNLRMLDKIKNIISKENNSLKNNLSFYQVDLREEEKLRKVFKTNLDSQSPIDFVIHCAGMKSVAESNNYPIKYWSNNVGGTLALIQIMNEFKCYKIIFSSSATIYGLGKEKLINENGFINPINPYGQTKACIEKLLENIFNSNFNNWVIANLRYFNPAGAHSSGLIGESPKGIANNIFPVIAKVGKRKINKLKIFGNDWDTHDGTGVRDYIHVMDLAKGHFLCLKYLERKKRKFLNLNLGTGIGTSVLDLIKKYQSINNIDIPYEFVSRRQGDYGYVVADNSKATSLLNWQPKRSIDQMCKDSWNFSKLIQ